VVSPNRLTSPSAQIAWSIGGAPFILCSVSRS
jgi:hypothetical protein